jgi:hypothetical protein
MPKESRPSLQSASFLLKPISPSYKSLLGQISDQLSSTRCSPMT